MAVRTTMTNNYIKPADAVKQSKASRASGATGYTDRGTAIVTANSGMDKNAFLNILVAQLTNMDPTQDQDSTAYVTQMAEFATIEQMNNLNTTMLDFSHQQMVGQVAILRDLDSDGNHKFGLITQVYKSGTTTYATVQDVTTGISSRYEISQIIGTSDSGFTNANFETALNSNFLAALQLASSGAKAVVIEQTSKDTSSLDKDNNEIITTTTTTVAKKCVIKSAYLDKQKSMVNVTVALLDDDGNETGETKVYNYDDIVIAGDLTDEVMDEAVKSHNTTTVSSKNKATGVAVDNPKIESKDDIQSDKNEDTDNSVSESESGSITNTDKEIENNINTSANDSEGKEVAENSTSGTNSNADNVSTENKEVAASYAKAVSSTDDKRNIEEEDKVLARIAGI